MNYKANLEKTILKDELLQLDQRQMKLFYSVLVHYWLKNNSFISKQNFHNLWCELNKLCGEADDGFPEPYDDFELMKSFCQAHPFYFIDRLSPEVIINLFCQHLDDNLDLLSTVVNKLRTEGLKAAYGYANANIGLTDDLDKLRAQTEEYVILFS